MGAPRAFSPRSRDARNLPMQGIDAGNANGVSNPSWIPAFAGMAGGESGNVGAGSGTAAR